MGLTRVTRNYQMTLPRDVREMARIRAGDRLVVEVVDGMIVVRKLDENPVLAAAGSWSVTKETPEEYERRLRRGWSKRLRREQGA